MRGIVLIPSAMVVMGLAVWAYQENYRTQAAAQKAETVAQEIGALRERRKLLEAEWAYLNRPARLADLAELSFPQLGLLPMRPEQFGTIDDVPERPTVLEEIFSSAVETRGAGPLGADREEALP